jgi:hypothetical protein
MSNEMKFRVGKNLNEILINQVKAGIERECRIEVKYFKFSV